MSVYVWECIGENDIQNFAHAFMCVLVRATQTGCEWMVDMLVSNDDYYFMTDAEAVYKWMYVCMGVRTCALGGK